MGIWAGGGGGSLALEIPVGWGTTDPGNPGGRGVKNLAIRRVGVDFLWNNPLEFLEGWGRYI